MARALKDLVIAIYHKDCYAGATILKLEKILYDEDVPEKYNTYEYEIKLMSLVECDQMKTIWDTETIIEFVNRLKEHYPHSPSVCNTIDKVAVNLMKEEMEY